MSLIAKKKRFFKLNFLIFSLLTLMLLAACEEKKEIKWQEEVKFNAGDVLIVSREESYRKVYNGNNNGLLLDDEEVTLTTPLLGQVQWRGEGVVIIAVDADVDGNVYIVARRVTQRAQDLYSMGHDGILALKYGKNKNWERMETNMIPDFMRQNLIYYINNFIDDKDNSHPTITLSDKNMKNSKLVFYEWRNKK